LTLIIYLILNLKKHRMKQKWEYPWCTYCGGLVYVPSKHPEFGKIYECLECGAIGKKCSKCGTIYLARNKINSFNL
jgi:predicted RNA-binding Zn-ribbon protein involved in translation (DUF1610 family)